MWGSAYALTPETKTLQNRNPSKIPVLSRRSDHATTGRLNVGLVGSIFAVAAAERESCRPFSIETLSVRNVCATLPVCLIAYVLVFQAERAPPLYRASCRWDFVRAAWRRGSWSTCTAWSTCMACSCAREPCGGVSWELVAPHHFELRSLCFKRHGLRCPSILTWYRGNRDQQGGSSSRRPFHCTSVGLTAAIVPNVDNSGTQFISVGVCVRANP